MCMYALSNVYVYTPGLYSIYSTVYSIDDGVLYLFYPPPFLLPPGPYFSPGDCDIRSADRRPSSNLNFGARKKSPPDWIFRIFRGQTKHRFPSNKHGGLISLIVEATKNLCVHPQKWWVNPYFGGAKSIWDQWVLINLRVWLKQQEMAVNQQEMCL